MSAKKKTSTRGVVLVTVVILAIFSGLFLLEFIGTWNPPDVAVETTLTADTYMTEVSALLENADASRGEAVINKYECHACHIGGAGQIAPAFIGLGELAAARRPPLTAAAYLYESIINPGVYLVEKEPSQTYPNSMPANYHERLTDQEMGDVIAYLLVQ